MAAAAFEMYVDDSGSEPQGKIFFLGGFISTVDAWTRLSNAWDAALALSPSLEYFKMSEAAAFREQFDKRRGWNETNRQDRLVTLARIINDCAMLRVSVSVRHDLFEKYVLSLPAIERNLAVDEPYVMLAMHLVSGATMFAYDKGIRDQINFIFDDQLGFKDELRQRWPAYKRTLELSARGRQLVPLVGSEEPQFLDEKQRKPLQAADFYIWQARSHYMDNHRFPNQKIIVPMNPTLKLFRHIPTEHWPMTEDVLIRQYQYLVRVGEQFKKDNPLVKLIEAATDRKERRKQRRRTKKQKRAKAT
jgi:hypothetical protein